MSAPRMAPLVYWGRWNTSYQNVNDTTQTGEMKGLWVGGRETPSKVVEENLDATGFTGTFKGDAHGLRNQSDFLNGDSQLNVDFGKDAFECEFDFSDNGGPLMKGEGNIDADRLKGKLKHISNETLSDEKPNTVNGTFFGPNADSVGGSFEGGTQEGNQYQGVFGAERQP